MTFRIVLPVIDPEMGAEFLASLDSSLYPEVILVDNCKRPMKGVPAGVTVLRRRHNLGVSGSWNLAVDVARKQGADRFVFCTASLRFGLSAGADLPGVAALAAPWGASPVPTHLHSVVLTSAFFDAVGPVDENFHPAYYEDIDLFRRGALLGIHVPEVGVLDAVTVRDGHGVDRLRSDFAGRPTINFEALDDYWQRKWGFDWHAHNAYDTSVGYQQPFGDSSKPLSWWPPVPSLPALRHRYRIVGR